MPTLWQERVSILPVELKELLLVFNANSVEYLVVEGHAVGLHSEPRATKDLDVFIGLYLFHSFVFFFVSEKAKPVLNLKVIGRDTVGTTMVLCFSMLLAHLSYRYFEANFLSLKRKFIFVSARD
jgi:hypothetical protein